MSKPLPSYLRTFRRRGGLTQEDLAFLLDVGGAPEVSRLERNRRQPNARVLLAVEIIFGKPSKELFPSFVEQVEQGIADRTFFMYRVLSRRTRTWDVDRKIEHLLEVSSRVDGARKRKP